MIVEIRNGETISSLRSRVRRLTLKDLDKLQLLPQSIEISVDRNGLCEKLHNEIAAYLRTISNIEEVDIIIGLVKHIPTIGDFDQSLINVPVLILSQLNFNPFIGSKSTSSYLATLSPDVWHVINPNDIKTQEHNIYDLSSICSFFREMNGYENLCAAVISEDYNDSYGLLSAMNDIDGVSSASYMAYADTVFVRKRVEDEYIPRWIYNIGTVSEDNTILVPVTTLYKYLYIRGLDTLNTNHENSRKYCTLYKCW